MSRWFVALALVGAACSDIDSSNVFTDGMSAVIRGTSTDGSSTEIVATLRAGGMGSTTFVKLDGDDRLVATYAEQSAPLQEVSLGALTSYVATVQGADPDETFTVALERTLDDGAPSSTFAVPEPFALTTDPAEIDPTEPVQIAWEPSGSAYQTLLEVSGECIGGGVRDLEGDGGATTIPSSLLEQIAEQPGASCPVNVTISKVRGGQLDQGFGEGGLVQGVQRRSLSFTISFD